MRQFHSLPSYSSLEIGKRRGVFMEIDQEDGSLTSLVAKRQMRPHPFVTPRHQRPPPHNPSSLPPAPPRSSSPLITMNFIPAVKTRLRGFEKNALPTDRWIDGRTDGQTLL